MGLTGLHWPWEKTRLSHTVSCDDCPIIILSGVEFFTYNGHMYGNQFPSKQVYVCELCHELRDFLRKYYEEFPCRKEQKKWPSVSLKKAMKSLKFYLVMDGNEIPEEVTFWLSRFQARIEMGYILNSHLKVKELTEHALMIPEYEEIPLSTMRAIISWIVEAWPAGDFVTGLLENDLSKAVFHADRDNYRYLKDIVLFLHNYAPAKCWGSPEKCKKWSEKGGKPDWSPIWVITRIDEDAEDSDE